MSTPEEIDALNQRAHLLYREKSAEAQILAERACTLASALGYQKGYLNGLLNHGRAMTLQGGYQEAIPLFSLAQSLAEEQGLQQLVAECLQETARAHFAIADYDAALQFWSRCLDISHSAQAHEAWLRALIGLGQIYLAHGDSTSALAHHRWALNSWKEGDDPTLYISACINVGLDLYDAQRFDEALEILTQTQSAHREQQAEILGIIGLIYLAKGDFVASNEALSKAQDINLTMGNALGLTTNLLALSRLAMARKNLPTANDLLKKALNKALDMHTPHLQLQIELALSEICELRGQWQEALEHFKIYHSLQLETMRQVSPHKLQAMEMQLEIEKTRMENAQLRRRNASERQERRRVERMVGEDPLTGLLNRRGLEQSAYMLLMPDSDPVSALMIDVDYFKKINDTWGHETGDKVLRQIGALLKSGCRQGDLVSRWGGEEFAVLLQNRDVLQGTEVAERLRRLVARFTWEKIASGLNVTISIGVVQYHEDDDLTLLLQRADEKLYAAKHSGRNQVAF